MAEFLPFNGLLPVPEKADKVAAVPYDVVDSAEAAALAAYYSKATADLVAVDYTAVKNIKKPAGKKPGFVIYHTNYTAFVKPIARIGEKKDG